MTQNMQKFQVLITAAAGGLGKAFAAECASRGWDLFLTDIRGDLLNPLAEGLTRQFGVMVSHYPGDLTNEAERDALWQEIDRRGLKFHFLINVAGMEYEGAFTERTIEELRTILELNVTAGVEMTSQALRRRAPDSPFYILNISSLAGFYPMPMKAVYAASKRFIIEYSLALREELRSSGVHVTVLCPAGMPTCERSIRGIERQGLMGLLTMTQVGDVAYRSIEHTLAGRAVYIPRVFNRLIHALTTFLPSSWKAAFVRRRWSKAHRAESVRKSDIHQQIE